VAVATTKPSRFLAPEHPGQLRCTRLDWSLSAEQGALLVRGDRAAVALVGVWSGSRAIITSDPVAQAPADADPFALLGEGGGAGAASDDPDVAHRSQAAATGAAHGSAVGGGWFGYLGFGLSAQIERIGAPPPPAVAMPGFALSYYDNVLRLDSEGVWWFEALVTPARREQLDRRLEELRRRAATDLEPRPFSTDPWTMTPTPAGHAEAVRACRERIHAGDLFQANICARLHSRLRGDAIDLFARGCARLHPEYAAFVAGEGGALASLSPELFLRRRGRRVWSAPIKGTRERPVAEQAASLARAELLASAKDRAENVMIVDLVRNDLGRVCEPGSVEVSALGEVVGRVGVWHLVSEVTGRLRAGVDDGELLRATFPPGSVTGAPKVAALGVIHELESARREVYTGAIGYLSPVAGLELNVAIRTFESRGEDIWLGVGGGVVADSDPQAEAQECAVKAAPLLAAIGANLAAPIPNAASNASNTAGATGPIAGAPLIPRILRASPRPRERPDPAHGVFETILVTEKGGPLALDAHLARLAASTQALYDQTILLAELRRQLIERARPGRLRVNAVPRGPYAPLQIELQGSPLPVRDSPTTLATVALPGGLGAHKWVDRRLLDAFAAASAPDLPLLVDLDGWVLESARASVFLVEDQNTLVTPPNDGRILPSVSRARVIVAAREAGHTVLEQRVTVERLLSAEEVFVTAALLGAEPVGAIDGHPVRRGSVGAELNALIGTGRPRGSSSTVVAGARRP
jgi:para-aminobenzoate synthetase/4-amino-4-deoxychorismate lyase